MNYLFIHISPNDANIQVDNFTFNFIPDYYLLQMKHTAEVDNSCKVHFICNPDNIQNHQYKIIHQYSINIVDYKSFLDNPLVDCITKYSIDRGLGKLTLYRFSFAYLFMNYFKINEIIFQEADTPIFFPFDVVKQYFSHNHLSTCGMSSNNNILTNIFYSDNKNQLLDISKFIEAIIKTQYINDMSVIYMYQIQNKNLNILPSLPSETDNFIFDPNSWGQYIAGDNHQKSPGFIDSSHKISRDFLIPKKDQFSIQKDFKDNKYKLKVDGKTYSFYNLHIHNKDAIKDFI